MESIFFSAYLFSHENPKPGHSQKPQSACVQDDHSHKNTNLLTLFTKNSEPDVCYGWMAKKKEDEKTINCLEKHEGTWGTSISLRYHLSHLVLMLARTNSNFNELAGKPQNCLKLQGQPIIILNVFCFM